MMPRNLRSVALVTAVASIGLTACSSTGSGSPGGSTGSDAQKVTVGFVELHADTFFGQIKQGVQQGLGPGGEIIAINYDSDAGKEAQAYADLISRGVKAIITSPADPAGSVGGIRNAFKAGIPVICVNTCINDADAQKYVAGFVVSDNTALGTQTGAKAASFIKDKLSNNAQIAMLNCDKFDVCKLRKAGFLKALDDAGVKYTVAADQTAYEPDAAVPVASAELTAHPDVNIMWTSNDGGAIGAIKAIPANGRKGKTFLFGTDVSAPMCEGLLSADNILQSFTGQDGLKNGTKSAEIALKAVQDIKFKASPFEQLVPVINFDRSDPSSCKKWLADNPS